MFKRFLAFIEDQKLFNPDHKLLLAVSGGIDSMVLLHLTLQLDITFSIAHCNFSLREQESDLDAEFVKKYADTNNIECFIETFTTKEYAINESKSTQMAARELRYEWFNDLCNKHYFDFIATAHHLNDSIETELVLALCQCSFNLQFQSQCHSRINRPSLLVMFKFLTAVKRSTFAVENQG